MENHFIGHFIISYNDISCVLFFDHNWSRNNDFKHYANKFTFVGRKLF